MSPSAASQNGTDVVLAELVEEFTQRVQAGEPVNVESYVQRYPEHAERLRRLLPALALLDDLGRSVSASPGRALTESHEGSLAGVLGDFRIIREVGRGGMGVVYEAEQLSLRRRVALKVLPFAATMDPRHLQRFHNEAQAAACLHHTNIVPVFFVGCERGVHFYAMQFIDGQPLSEVIQRLRKREKKTPAAARAEPTIAYQPSPGEAAPTPLPAADMTPLTGEGRRGRDYYRKVAELGVQAAEALDHAHQLGIVHRDIKPGNLLVDSAGRLWVTDFGLAQVRQGEAGLTMPGEMVGTLRYMSPEQALAKRMAIDHRTDVYSLGATLYELLTLEPVFAGADRQELLRQIASEEPVKPRRLEKAVPAELETIVLKAMEKRPQDRYATARELADDLERFLEDRPIQARRPSLVQRMRKWCQRHKPWVRAAAAVSVLAVLGLAVGSVLVWRENQQKTTALADKEIALDQARRERDAADEERRWAHQAVEDMYTQVAESWLKRQPRLEPVQREFLEKALRYYAHEAEQQGDDPGVRRQVAAAQYRLGVIYGRLGRNAEAREALGRAVALFKRLAVELPGEDDSGLILAKSLYGLGNAALALGGHTEAAAAYRESIEAVKKSAGDRADSPDAHELLKAQDALAMTLAETGQRADAERMYRDAIDLGRQLVKASPGKPQFVYTLANVHNNLGNLLSGTGCDRDAEPEYREAARLFGQLAEEAPTEPDHRERWAFSLGNLATVLLRTDRPREAVALLRQVIARQQRLAEDFPAVPDYAWELANSQGNLGIVLRKLGEYAGAAESYRQAIATYRKLVAQFPANPAYRHSMGLVEGNLANLLGENLNRPKEAEEAHRRALEIQQQLVAEFPRVPAYRAQLAKTNSNLGGLMMRTGHPREAEEPLDQALKELEGLVAAAPDNVGFRGDLARTCNNRALVCVWHQGPPCPEASHAVALAKRAVELEPRKVNRWFTLAVAHFRAGDWGETIAAVQKARELGSAGELVGWFAAMAHWQLGDKEEARRRFRETALWMDRNAPRDEHHRRFRAEAAQLLGIEEQPTKTKEEPAPKQ